MTKRWRSERKTAFEDDWPWRRTASKNRPSSYRLATNELLLRKARQADMAAHINEWLASPGLQTPKPP